MITRNEAQSLGDRIFHVRIGDVDINDFGRQVEINIEFLDGPLQNEIVKFDIRIAIANANWPVDWK